MAAAASYFATFAIIGDSPFKVTVKVKGSCLSARRQPHRGATAPHHFRQLRCCSGTTLSLPRATPVSSANSGAYNARVCAASGRAACVLRGTQNSRRRKFWYSSIYQNSVLVISPGGDGATAYAQPPPLRRRQQHVSRPSPSAGHHPTPALLAVLRRAQRPSLCAHLHTSFSAIGALRRPSFKVRQSPHLKPPTPRAGR